jgi:sensor domain CHASE-containing protein
MKEGEKMSVSKKIWIIFFLVFVGLEVALYYFISYQCEKERQEMGRPTY